MQIALEVNNSSSDQAPETTTEQTSNIQQTQSGEGLGAPSQPTATTTAAQQQELMNLLRSEAAGSPAGTGVADKSPGEVLLQLGIGVAAVFLVIALAIFFEQQLKRFYKSQSKPKPARKSTKRNK